MKFQYEDIVTIYQLNDDDENHEYRFASMRELNSMNLKVEYDRYHPVYKCKRILKCATLDAALEAIFYEFNVNRPDDFFGHSLSVSDVIVLEHGGFERAYFVDSFGFVELDHFWN